MEGANGPQGADVAASCAGRTDSAATKAPGRPALPHERFSVRDADEAPQRDFRAMVSVGRTKWRQARVSLGTFGGYGRSHMLTARDIMTDRVVTIGPDAFLQEAIEVLLAMEVSGLPVVDDQGALIGIISEFALLTTAYDAKTACDQVGRHMTIDVLTVDVDDPIRKVADQFIVHRVRRVPVLEKGRLVGVITRRDVLKAVYENEPQVCSLNASAE